MKHFKILYFMTFLNTLDTRKMHIIIIRYYYNNCAKRIIIEPRAVVTTTYHSNI